jgi:acetyl esterase
VYWPRNAAPNLPAILFFHGGGWVVGDLDSHDATCRLLCQEVGALVVSVDYRLSPEHPFPAAVEDAHAAACWVHDRAADLGADPAHVAVAGESSGGNLAAVTCLVARDRSGPRFKAQLLLFPVTNFAFDTPSYAASAEGYVLTRAAMEWYWAQYLADPLDGQAPYASPLRAASLEGLPAAIIVSAEWDPLRDEGEAYGQRLMADGVPTEILRYNGVIHGFTSMTSLAATELATKTIYGNLRALLAE